MIELENITKVYRMGKVDVFALNGVSISLKKGDMVAIVGASGSGKSTMLHVIGCLDKPTSGKYILDGQDISHLNDNKLADIRNKKLGFVFQEFNLLTRITAVANVELPMIYGNSRQKRQRAIKALERVGLGGRANHKPTEMSGGEQQRVAIARALVTNPQVILADEPTGNLDSASSNDIIALFRELHQEGITIIVITHEMDIAEQTQRIIRLLDGKIISDEPVSGNNNVSSYGGDSK